MSFRTIVPVFFLAVLSPISATEKFDFDRVVPVPETEQVPIFDFFRPALLRSPEMNRAGTHLAALVNTGEDRVELLIYEIETKKINMVSGGGDKDIYRFMWLNDERLLFLISNQKLYELAMMVVDVDKIRHSYPVIQYYGARLVSIPERNRLRPLVWLSHDLFDGRNIGVVEVNTSVDAGPMINLQAAAGNDWGRANDVRDSNDRHITKSYPLPPGAFNTGYMSDGKGELAFAFTGSGEGYFDLHRLDGKKWIKSPVDLDAVDIVSSGDRPNELIVVEPRQPGKPRAARFMDAVTGELGEVVLADNAYDFDGWLYRDFETRSIVGAVYQRSGPHSVWFDPGYEAVQKLVQASFPNDVVQLMDRDREGRFLVATRSDRQPAVYHFVDLKKRSMGLVKSSAPWIDPKRMRSMQVMKFKTNDGRELEAYVTLPKGASKKKPVPLVVLPHGGPWVRDTWGFDPEAQFLASRGYAVMQPNYRGSPGYDWMFPEDDRWEFQKMHDDVTAAAKTLLASGVIDPDRVAIMGASFGAYLALSGVVNEPDFYRCAITIAGVFDWERVMRDAKRDQYTSTEYAYLKRRLGDPKKAQEKFDAISPARRVDRVRVPVFVSHGKEDNVAEVGESKRLISELKKNNVPHEVLLVGGEGHGMSRLENRVELYSRVEAFLQKNLAPRETVAAAHTAR